VLTLTEKLIRRELLKHGTGNIAAGPQRSMGNKSPVTVCIACLCNWAYSPTVSGRVAITASDRQITVGDIEYDPAQLKLSVQGKRALILVSGEYTIHSEALLNCQRTIIANSLTEPFAIAEAYAQAINDVKRRHAATLYLSPLNLTSDIFSGHATVSVEILASLANQMQDYRGDHTEALVVASDDFAAHIYHIDKRSLIRCYDDVGFAAIGIGAWHAKSQLMRSKFTNLWNFTPALALTYAAKKQAEIAPGVGEETDMFVHCRPVKQAVSADKGMILNAVLAI
jgi:hypothetical protein